VTTEPAKSPINAVGVALGIGLLLLLACGALAWLLLPRALVPSLNISIADTEALIRSWGAWGVAGSIGLMVAHSFLPFPAEIIALANGMLYGPFWGSIITWVGAMLGAIIAFALARLLGRPFVYRVLSERHRQQLSEWSLESGGKALFIGRLIPLIAFNLLNYGAALTNISWWTFIWATGLGILPLTILLNVFGDNMSTMTTWYWAGLLLGALGVLVWLLARRPSRKTRPAE
jgi:uncharacterized membrane protein YdjX (TVP38/TMEM64 family)